MNASFGRALLFFSLAVGPSLIAWAEEPGPDLSGRVGVEGGTFQPAQGAVHPYLGSLLILGIHPEITEGLSFDWAGQADGQEAGVPMPFSEPEASRRNIVDLQWESVGADGGAYRLAMDQAALHWASGPLELRAGLFKPDWGHSIFGRPTDYFFPVPPLSWLKDEPSASEGADASCFLFDDLSAEGAARFLEGGDAEWVVRLIQRGIGLTVTPSFARLQGKDGFGWEVMGTFPTVQVRFEGVDWRFANGGDAMDWNLGVSTSRYGVKYTAEVLRDGTGGILGGGSGYSQGSYLFISAEGTLTPEWKMSTAVVVLLDGGTFLFRPKVTWTFTSHWEAGLQAQVPLGDWDGPLHTWPGRCGFSLDYLL
ncbi:MAG TPA: hypothetical protein VHE12_03645 [bacterium]|nr:hypothetical protein [bacterium]